MSIFFNNGLRFLKVLDCREAPLNTFPKEILKLYNLRYLSLRDTNVSSIPKSIGKLQKLNTVDLRYINVTELPAEILQLKQLRQLLVYRYVHRFTTSLEVVGFKALRGLETLSSLQSLCFIEVDPFECLQALPNLVHIELVEAYDGETLCFKADGFKMLKVLLLGKFDRLKRVTIERGTMSSLEKLMLRDCKLLDEVPTGIECLSNLKDLEFIDMSNEFLMKLNQRTDLLHISTIFVGYEADWGMDGYLI
ncbi:hypothetical protein FEM48_Zijuj11G0133400 [Ziziphus jujuba var. spinosa]|uniref:Disease resistance R13L4/SHOC-2-like LRR domain-containing protein n=1 Tax=Ziziphus jujuba var. spinosa TaxID=714518 RepID=A0A978UJ62_ZIZJJ|nr:hypothetical protein FEM48_Zijuj11G0133400 [Ziziphus jujuba var. spinosa]